MRKQLKGIFLKIQNDAGHFPLDQPSTDLQNGRNELAHITDHCARTRNLRNAILAGCVAFLGVQGAMMSLGCFHRVESSFSGTPPSDGEFTCIALLPFNNITDSPEAESIFSDLVAVELYRSKRFNILESSEVERILEKQGIGMDGSLDNESARKIGKILGVDGVMMGSVNEYGFRNLNKRTKAVPVAGIRAALIDVKKGNVLWSGEAWENGFDLTLSHRMPLSEVAQLVTKKLLHQFISGFSEREINPERVCWREAGEVILAKKVEEIARRKPTIQLEKKPKELFDMIQKNKSAVIEGVSFKPGGIALTPASIASLQSVGPAFKALLGVDPSIRLRIEGHSDALESGGESQDISLKRAERVREFLVKNFSLPSDKIDAVGSGSGKPIMPNTTVRGREKNRRVELHVLTGNTPAGQ